MIQFTTLYQDDYILIEEASTEKYLKVTWLQHVDTEKFKSIAQHIPPLIRKRGSILLLSDDRKVLFLDMAGQSYVYRHVYPFLTENDKFFLAHVVSAATFDMMDIYRISEEMKNNPELYQKLETNIFFSPEAAEEWLLEKAKQLNKSNYSLGMVSSERYGS